MVEVAFYALSVITILSAIVALEARDIVYGAVALAISFLGIAGFFVLLDAPFLAVFQILVYVGAIAVLIIFTVMLVRREKWLQMREGVNKLGAVAGALMLALAMWYTAFSYGLAEWWARDEVGVSFQEIGREILTVYWPALEVLALVLAASIIGAITLAKVERA